MGISFTKVTWVDNSVPPAIDAANLQRFDDALDTIKTSGVFTNDAQTLTNKTLTSPVLSGTPTTPTAAAATNTTQVASTAFTHAAIAADVAPLTDFKDYNAATTYALNDPVFYEGVPYRSLSDGNTNHQPDISGTWWEVTGGGNVSPVVFASYTGSGTSYSTNNPINFATKVLDTHNAVTTGSDWKFTAPINGVYTLTGALYVSATTDISIYKNGNVISGVDIGYIIYTGQRIAISYTIYLVKDDYVFLTGIGATVVFGSHIQITRIGG